MYWYNGQVCSGERLEVGVGDPGFLYGATTFTTLRVYEGGLLDPRTAWGEHLQRLQGAIAALGWMAPDWQMLETGARCLAAEFVVLRVTLFADGRVLITGRIAPSGFAAATAGGGCGSVGSGTSVCSLVAATEDG